MNNCQQRLIVWILIVSCFFIGRSYGQSYENITILSRPEVQWPQGKTMALSLSFDDARLSQVDKAPDYKNPILPIEQRVEDLLSHMTLKEKVRQMNIPCCYDTQIGWGLFNHIPWNYGEEDKEIREKQLEGCRKWAEGTHNDVFGPGGSFFTLSDNLIYEGPKRQSELMNELQKIAVGKTRLGIPLFQIEEGTHGLMCYGGFEVK